MNFPNPLDVLLLQLSDTLPHLKLSIDRHPGMEDKAAWVEITDSRGRSVEVEYRPGQGFGLHTDADDTPFSGPDEVIATPEETVARVKTLFA
jgi:hypothetical protein